MNRIADLTSGLEPGGYTLTAQTVQSSDAGDQLWRAGADWIFANLDAPQKKNRDQVQSSKSNLVTAIS